MFNLRKKFNSLYINIYTDGTKDIRMFGGENLDVRDASDSQVEFYGRQAEKEGLTRHDTEMKDGTIVQAYFEDKKMKKNSINIGDVLTVKRDLPHTWPTEPPILRAGESVTVTNVQAGQAGIITVRRSDGRTKKVSKTFLIECDVL